MNLIELVGSMVDESQANVKDHDEAARIKVFMETGDGPVIRSVERVYVGRDEHGPYLVIGARKA